MFDPIFAVVKFISDYFMDILILIAAGGLFYLAYRNTAKNVILKHFVILVLILIMIFMTLLSACGFITAFGVAGQPITFALVIAGTIVAAFITRWLFRTIARLFNSDDDAPPP